MAAVDWSKYIEPFDLPRPPEVVWVLMTGRYENYGLHAVFGDPLAALNEKDGEWTEEEPGGRWLNEETIEGAEVVGVVVE